MCVRNRAADQAEAETSLARGPSLRIRIQFTHEFLVPAAQIVAPVLLIVSTINRKDGINPVLLFLRSISRSPFRKIAGTGQLIELDERGRAA